MYICSLMLLNADKWVQREYPDDRAYSTTLKAIKAGLFCTGLKNLVLAYFAWIIQRLKADAHPGQVISPSQDTHSDSNTLLAAPLLPHTTDTKKSMRFPRVFGWMSSSFFLVFTPKWCFCHMSVMTNQWFLKPGWPHLSKRAETKASYIY